MKLTTLFTIKLTSIYSTFSTGEVQCIEALLNDAQAKRRMKMNCNYFNQDTPRGNHLEWWIFRGVAKEVCGTVDIDVVKLISKIAKEKNLTPYDAAYEFKQTQEGKIKT